MEIALWAFAGVVTVLIGYTARFTQATLSMGKELAETVEGTGFQDAITPPWQTNLAILSYMSAAAAVAVIWWQLGWLAGLGALALSFIGGGFVGAMLPNKDSAHFRGLIIRSMVSRHADFVRDGDQMRAEAMQGLLERAGVDLDSRLFTRSN